MMDEQTLLTTLNAEFDEAEGSDGSTVANERVRLMDHYLSRLLGNEVEGKSKVVTSDIADVVGGMMPNLLRTFASSENLVTFEPVDQDDETQAEQESDFVNYVFFKQNDAFTILYSWFFDALVQKNGIVKAWWDESESRTKETYEGISDEDVAELEDDEDLELASKTERQGTLIETITDPMTGGELQVESEGTVFDVEFIRRNKRGRVHIEPVPPEEYRIFGARSIDPNTARGVGQERIVTRSELREMGFDEGVVDDLEPDAPEALTQETRNRLSVEEQTGTPSQAHDRSLDEFVLREAYLHVDYDDDGHAELRKIFATTKTILENEETDRQVFHALTPLPLPHRHFGRSMSEQHVDIQMVKTTLVRQALDNLYQTNNPSHAVWEQGIGEYTLDDLMNLSAGSVNRFARPPNEAWQAMAVPFTAGDSFPMLEFWDKAKRERSGIAGDGEGLNPEQLKNIQTSVLAQANDISRMKIEHVIRIFAETGLKSLFRHIHELLMKHDRKMQTVKLRNEWVDVNPSEWRTRFNLTVNIGLGIGNKEQNLLHLQNIWERQIESVNSGVPAMVTPRKLYNTAIEMAKNARFRDPSKFFDDPGDEQFGAEQSQLQMQVLQLQAEMRDRDQKLNAREQDIDRERNQLQHEREMLKINNAKEEAENKILVKLDELAVRIAEMEAKTGEDVAVQSAEQLDSRTEGPA